MTATVTNLDDLHGQKFATIYADPPWQYDNRASRGAAENHYSTMTVDEICEMPVGELAADSAHLHLWTTNAFMFESIRVIEAWGFQYEEAFVWCKPQMGMGNFWRVSHEILMLGVRGNLPFQDKPISWGEFPRKQHSEKPEQVRGLIERTSPGPYLELFGRKPVIGWTVFGNQIDRQNVLAFA